MISDSQAAMCYQATLYRVLELFITTNCKSDINHDYVARSDQPGREGGSMTGGGGTVW